MTGRLIQVEATEEAQPNPYTITVQVPAGAISFAPIGTFLLLILWKYIVQPQFARFKLTLGYAISIDQTINGLLNRMLAKTGAISVALLMPHDGTVFANQLRNWKLTMTHEARLAGRASSMNLWQNVAIGQAANFLGDLFVHGHCDVSCDVQSSFICQYMAQAGIYKLTSALIGDTEDILGIVLICYDEDCTTVSPTMLEQEMRQLAAIVAEPRENWLKQMLKHKLG